MSLIKSKRPSPWMLVAVAALAFAMVGTAVAGPSAVSKLTKSKVKSIARKQADKELKANVSGSHVNLADKATDADKAKTADTATTATNADALGGKALDSVRSVAASGANATVVASIGGGTTVVSTSITLPVESRVLINGVAELFGAAADERAQCVLRDNGATASLGFETTFDDIGSDNEATLAATAGPTLAAGAHTLDMRCSEIAGTVGKDDAAITAVAVPTP
jgi:hypothetical protein